MVRNALNILKHRWPEVLLIVVLHAAMMFFVDELAVISETMSNEQASQIPAWASFLMGFGGILYVIVWMMLYLGFFKTAAMAGPVPQQPMELLLWGRIYFWKMLGFQILFGVVLWIITGALAVSLGWIVFRTEDITTIPDWFANICVLAGILFLMKPLLFIPARIIVCDDTITSAAAAIRMYRLRDINGLFVLVAVGIGGILMFMLLSGLASKQTVVYYIITGIHHLAFSVVFLWMTLTAVLWVKRQLDDQQEQLKESQTQQ